MNLKILIPTYNEIESIQALLIEIENQLSTNSSDDFSYSILVIDDNSPDGTADFVSSLAKAKVKVLRRERKEGLGNAYKAGISHAMQDPAVTHIATMDADGSHRVVDLVALITKTNQEPGAALILGSRWITGGSIENWPNYRKWLSKAGTKYAKWALKMKVSDLTGGFRIYPRWALEKIDLNQIISNGYCYQIEMAFAIKHLNRPITEVPITFVERQMGRSKMSQKIVLEAMWRTTRLGLAMRLNPSADKLHYVK